MASDLSHRLAAEHGITPSEVHDLFHPDEDIDAHFAGLAPLAEDFLHPEEDPPFVPEDEKVFSCPTCRDTLHVPDLAGTLWDDCPDCQLPVPYVPQLVRLTSEQSEVLDRYVRAGRVAHFSVLDGNLIITSTDGVTLRYDADGEAF